jgi:hypothetical protein
MNCSRRYNFVDIQPMCIAGIDNICTISLIQVLWYKIILLFVCLKPKFKQSVRNVDIDGISVKEKEKNRNSKERP